MAMHPSAASGPAACATTLALGTKRVTRSATLSTMIGESSTWRMRSDLMDPVEAPTGGTEGAMCAWYRNASGADAHVRIALRILLHAPVGQLRSLPEARRQAGFARRATPILEAYILQTRRACLNHPP